MVNYFGQIRFAENGHCAIGDRVSVLITSFSRGQQFCVTDSVLLTNGQNDGSFNSADQVDACWFYVQALGLCSESKLKKAGVILVYFLGFRPDNGELSAGRDFSSLLRSVILIFYCLQV